MSNGVAHAHAVEVVQAQTQCQPSSMSGLTKSSSRTSIGSYAPPPRQKRTLAKVDDEFMATLKQFVKKKRPRALSKEERLDILVLQAHLRYEHEQEQQRMKRLQQQEQQAIEAKTTADTNPSSASTGPASANATTATSASKAPTKQRRIRRGANAAEKCALYLGRDIKSVRQVWTEYVKHGRVREALLPGRQLTNSKAWFPSLCWEGR